MTIRDLFSRRPRPAPNRRYDMDWLAQLTPREWADLPVHHPREDAPAHFPREEVPQR